MKNLIFLLFVFPVFVMAQGQSRIEKSINLKVAVMQNFVKMGDGGEQAFWQTKGKITYAIVNYTEAQNPQFKELFINQYRELLPIYKRMVVSEDQRDTTLFIKTLIRQEEDYRKLLTPEQLVLYRNKLNEIESGDPKLNDGYTSLYFSDGLLKEYKASF